MEESVLKRVLLVVAALAVVAAAAAAVIGLLGGVEPRQAASRAMGAQVTGGQVTVDQSRSVPLDGVRRIEVDVVSSDVTVSESSDGALHAHLFGTANLSRGATEPELLVSKQGGTASVRVEHRNLNLAWGRTDLKLEVAIPKGYRGDLLVHGVSSDVGLPPWRTFGALEITTVSGDVDLGAFTADSFRNRTVSGDLAAPAASARTADLGSTSGRINVGGLTGDLSARTVSGDLRLDWKAFSGSIDVSSTSGSVTLGIPAGSGFALDAGSTSGRITSDHPVTVRGSSTGPGRHNLVGEVGKGGGSVRVRTISGEIRIGM
jgi:hypothetical protein